MISLRKLYNRPTSLIPYLHRLILNPFFNVSSTAETIGLFFLRFHSKPDFDEYFCLYLEPLSEMF